VVRRGLIAVLAIGAAMAAGPVTAGAAVENFDRFITTGIGV